MYVCLCARVRRLLFVTWFTDAKGLGWQITRTADGAGQNTCLAQACDYAEKGEVALL